jgi:predicted membrane protein
MFQRIYASVWLIFAFALIALFLAGNLSMFAIVFMGFVALGLVFVGMMCLLPSIVAHPREARPAQRSTEPTSVPDARKARDYERFLQPWFFPEDHVIRQPRCH